MNRSFLTIFALIISANVFTQGVAFWVGHTHQPFKSISFSNYFTDYNNNEAFVGYLEKPFDAVQNNFNGISTNMSVFVSDGYDFRGNNGFTFLKSINNTADFKNGDKRHVDVYMTDWNLDIGFGFSLSYFFFLNFNVGMNSRFGKALLYFEYPDNTISFGKEKTVSGVYSGWRLTGLLGGTIGISAIPYVQFIYRIDYVFKPYADLIYQTQLVDRLYFIENIDIGGAGDSFYNDFYGWRHTFGIQISIGQYED
ncbi:MAG TPA: hypothetical protein PKN32_12930 [Bacteroidales bacterium]|nr:hypothetical protein [Bacteroidales bacterium]